MGSFGILNGPHPLLYMGCSYILFKVEQIIQFMCTDSTFAVIDSKTPYVKS